MRPRISIIIPTQRRLEPLLLAARSVLRQRSVALDELELIVVDNDQRDSARSVVARVQTEASFPVVYLHEPTPGVASARNVAVAQAVGDFIAFLDDDEEADDLWLFELLKVQSRYDADVVFGPVRGRAPASVLRHRAYLEAFFSRTGPKDDGLIDRFYGCGNSLIRRQSLPNPEAPFDTAYNTSGGEDDFLFAAMAPLGARFAWSADGFVWEDPAADRLNLVYTAWRGFAYGQGASFKAAKLKRWDRLAWFMSSGAGQAMVFGVLAACVWAVRSQGQGFALERAMRGLGKVFWGKTLHRRLYGRSADAEPLVNAFFTSGSVAT